MAGRVVFFLASVVVLSTNAFMVPSFRSKYVSSSSLRMSDAPQGPDPLDDIRQRMSDDPTYDPMKDEQAMQKLQDQLPSEFREFGNAMERLKVAFADASGGVDGLEDLDTLGAIAAKTEVRERLSSPQSKFFQEGAPEELEPFDEDKMKDLLMQAKGDFPDVPFSE